MKLYALHDKKAAAFSNFHVEKSDAQASRGFADAVSQPNSVFGKYAEDFELVAIADVEESSVLADVVVPYTRGYEVILTAAQVVALNAKAPSPQQLSLIAEE